MINLKYSVGNYAYFLGKIKRIEGVTERLRPDCGYFHIEGFKAPQKGIHVSPIKITEEIMLKCEAYWDDVLDEKDALVIDVTENIRIGWCGYLFLLIEGYTIQINNANSEYVHQLQNIYADLSGKELKLNL